MDENDLCDDSEDDDILNPLNLEDKCIVCDEFGKDGELWFRCTLCGLWCHEECSGCETEKDFVCDFCLKADKQAKKK